MTKTKVYVVDVFELHTETVRATSKKAAVKKVNEGKGVRAADVFDTWACDKNVRVVEESNG